MSLMSGVFDREIGFKLEDPPRLWAQSSKIAPQGTNGSIGNSFLSNSRIVVEQYSTSEDMSLVSWAIERLANM